MTNPIPAAAIEAGAKARAEARGTDWENLKHTFPGMATNIRTETRATLKAAIPELLDQIEQLQARLAAVEEVHIRREYWTETGEDICDTCSRRKQGDFAYWPCDTIKAARGE